MHPFAEFLRIIGRGPTLSRPLTREEAREAMRRILEGAVEPVQLGAFLLVLRTRGESAEEIAGMVDAVRETFAERPLPVVDLDWPSYADRHRMLPWFTASALLLARAGIRVLMHGIEGEGPATTRAGLAALGVRAARSVEEAGERLERTGFAYLPLEVLAPSFAALFGLRPVLGVRTAVNTAARALDPARAAAQLQGVFHPPYIALHAEVQRLLGTRRALTFKGGGGEVMRLPDKPLRAVRVAGGEMREETWPAIPYAGPRHPFREEPPEPARIAALWRGEVELPGPEAAIVGTAALALHLVGRAESMEAAEDLARELWRERPRGLPPA
ncbi:Bifunctional protein TrpGD [bacterium HR39]|nr:Bifunctional protein TrpGD [bacterium HR39]